jgi:hypothetical protein
VCYRDLQVIIPFCDIEEIVKKTTLKMLPNALRIVTKEQQGKGEKGYFFTSFWGQYRNECYRISKKLHVQVHSHSPALNRVHYTNACS